MLEVTLGESVRRSTLTYVGLLFLAVSLLAAFTGAPFGGPVPSALLGTAGLGLLQFVSIKRLPSASEALMDAAVLALLAMARDANVPLWAVPNQWVELWRLTPLGTGLASLLYVLGAISVRLRARRHIILQEALPIVFAPLLFNVVLALGSDNLMRQVGGFVTFDLASDAIRVGAGRILALWLFCEMMTGAFGMAIRGRVSRDLRLHGLFLACAVHAVLTPSIAELPQAFGAAPVQFVAACVAASFAQAGLWAIVFVLTGLVIGALHGKPPTFEASLTLWKSGFAKGAIYGGVFVFCVMTAGAILRSPALVQFFVGHVFLTAALAGTALFPLVATIVGSADGTPPFFGRLIANYRDPRAYARGLVLGLGVTLALLNLRESDGGIRFAALFLVGALTYAGTDIAFDALAILKGERKKLQTWRLYALGIGLGGFVGGALGWYFDAAQLGIVADRFWAFADVDYHTTGRSIGNFVNNTLFSKWASVDLGNVSGGVRLFYTQSLSGVINWSIAAPLFSVNYFLLDAFLGKNLGPIKKMLSREGVESLVEQAVRVMRWGLWMAPVIDTFLRMAPDPSWYNQDGAVRTVVASVADAILPAGDFRMWSLAVFTGLLAFDWLRILIWFDHMGLRVATLVNLTFLGGDRVDERAARFVGFPARTRVIPDGIRRFMTWAPLLIPFYIPRGSEWNTAWDGADRIRATGAALPAPVLAVVVGYAVALVVAVYVAWRIAARWGGKRPEAAIPMPLGVPRSLAHKPEHFALSNGLMGITLTRDGRGHTYIDSTARTGAAIDITRRPTDRLQARGPFFYLRDSGSEHLWSVGYEPSHKTGTDYTMRQPEQAGILIRNSVFGVRAEARVSLADQECVETWHIRLTNLSDQPRSLMLSSFQELAMHELGAYTRDSDFNAMHVDTWFLKPLNAIFMRNRLLRDGARKQVLRRMSREMAFHAVRPEFGSRLVGYEDSRSRFIGSGDLAHPEGMQPGRARDLDDQGLLATFDPAASLHVEVDLPANASRDITFFLGHAADEIAAARLAAKYVDGPAIDEALLRTLLETPRILDPLPALPAATWPFAFSPAGTDLVLTQRTPRPWAHVLANAQGYGAVVSNEGEIHSFAANERQNALTPFGFESVATSMPGQLIYVVDMATGETDTAGYVPFRREDAEYEVVYDLGSATFRKRRGTTELELTVFVLPDAPADVRLLTIRNRSNVAKQFRVVPYIDLALDESPASSRGRLATSRDAGSETLMFANWGNDFRKGVAFAATSLKGAAFETVRSRFFGTLGRGFENPIMVETGAPDPSRGDDGRRVAAFAGLIDVPAKGEAEVSVILGQTARHGDAIVTAAQYDHAAAASAALSATRAWWHQYLDAVQITTNQPEFDRLVNYWLPYQLLASRLWGRTGPNQRGGATGYRDQLQDVLPLVFFDPKLTRRQIVLHAGQQFLEGDVLKWWHAAPEGGTGLGQRTTAADPHLWLPYVLVRYIAATNDMSVLDEQACFLEGPQVPDGTDTITFVPRPSRETADVYEHCVRAIEHALAKKGVRGLPLLGGGDWNDGLDLAGLLGRGESVWVAFFLHDILTGFAEIAAKRAGEAAAKRFREEAAKLAKSLDNAWLGDHYALMFHDSGAAIDPASAMTSAWPILSGAVDFERGHAALEQGLAQLEQPDRILLLAPPFGEDSIPYPGRIADYPPGVRENGGQYTHGVSWTVDAYVRLADIAKARGDGELATQMRARAFDCWAKISPIGKTQGEMLGVYGLAPHQQPADIYEGASHGGRGGWSWYTGSAARMLSAAYAVVGIEMRNGEVCIAEDAFEAKGHLHVSEIRLRGKTHRAPAEERRERRKIEKPAAASPLGKAG
jgi:cyclic beta-1,2-glucan synthetase